MDELVKGSGTFCQEAPLDTSDHGVLHVRSCSCRTKCTVHIRAWDEFLSCQRAWLIDGVMRINEQLQSSLGVMDIRSLCNGNSRPEILYTVGIHC